MTNIKIWPKRTRPTIKPSEITLMPEKPSKNRKKDSYDPIKKKFERIQGKKKMRCSVCKTFGHKN